MWSKYSAKKMVEKGYKLARQGKLEEGILEFTKALEKDSQYMVAYFHRGVALVEAGKMSEGLKDLDLYISNFPEISAT